MALIRAAMALLCGFAACAQIEQPVIDLSDWPVKIGSEAQLFVDDYLIAKQAGVSFRLHPAEKHRSGPLIVPSPEWERLVLAYGSVLRDRDSGKLRMWYTNDTGIAYAESRDGISWEKPALGMEIDGRRTNVLTRGHRGRSDTLTVFENPDRSDPARRYLAYPFEYRYPDKEGVRETRREGIYLRTSADGIHWTERPDPVMYSVWRAEQDRPMPSNASLADVNHVTWDPKLRRFMGYIKLGIDGIRTRGLTESDDGIYWSQPRLILRADDRDRRGDQIYSMIAFPYESMWLGFIGLFHKETDDRMDIQLVTSRDGRNWSRSIREPFVGNGPNGGFDEGVIHMFANAPLLIGGKLYIYFGGYGPTHGVRLRDKPCGISLATLRPHGFISADGGPRPGTIVTRPLHFSGSKLHLNADVKQGGEIRVSVLDAAYQPAGSVSEAITDDSTDAVVRWPSAGGLKTQNPRLRFELKNASLYAFWID